MEKIWKIWVMLKYLRLKDQIAKAQLGVKYKNITDYFYKDIESVTEKSLYMFKRRLEPVIKQVKRLN